MRIEGKIEITGVDLGQLIRAAYSPSRQQGLGVFDESGRSDISDEIVQEIIERGKADRTSAVSMDYVNGRSIKLRVLKCGDRLFINNRWYDHSDDELAALLEAVGLDRALISEAREAEQAHIERVKKAALDYLTEHGGVIRENRGLVTNPTPDEQFPEDVEAGLWWLCDEGLVSYEYEVGGWTTWRLSTDGTNNE